MIEEAPAAEIGGGGFFSTRRISSGVPDERNLFTLENHFMGKTMGVAAILVVGVAAIFGIEGALLMWVLAVPTGIALWLVAKGAKWM